MFDNFTNTNRLDNQNYKFYYTMMDDNIDVSDDTFGYSTNIIFYRNGKPNNLINKPVKIKSYLDNVYKSLYNRLFTNKNNKNSGDNISYFYTIINISRFLILIIGESLYTSNPKYYSKWKDKQKRVLNFLVIFSFISNILLIFIMEIAILIKIQNIWT